MYRFINWGKICTVVGKEKLFSNLSIGVKIVLNNLENRFEKVFKIFIVKKM